LNHDEAPSTLEQGLASQARAFDAAAQDLHRRTGSGTGSATPRGGETAHLAEWARERGVLTDGREFEDCTLVSNSTSEHEVRYHKVQNRAWKRTWAGFYGQVPCPENGRLGRRNATPAEYLKRMALQIRLFASDIRLEGVCVSDKPSMIIGQPVGEPAFIISQDWLERSRDSSPVEIAAFLRDEGFEPVPFSYFGWYRSQDGMVIVDAKADNFITTEADIIALDLQMAQFTREEALAASLTPPPDTDDGSSTHIS
jgi:hypothetical protein